MIDNRSRTLASCMVIIPAHNEVNDVQSVIQQLKQYCSYPIIVVDDASTDGTRSKAREAGAIVIPLLVQLGAWGATQTGLRYAYSKGYQFVITMDADGQHQAASL